MHDGEQSASGGGHEGHGGHTTHMFRDRFWVSLALSIPVILYSEMVQMWLGFSMPQFPGSGWVAPVLGTFIFVWGGWPFLKGGFEEAREW
jgi:Cu2+-exporting ATPase